MTTRPDLATPSTSRERRASRRRAIAQTIQSRANKKRARAEVLADKMTAVFGSMTFLTLNAIWFAIWIPVNLGLIPGIQPFDPYPFGLLTTIVSLEAIFLAIFVLISQNRAEKIATLRQEVDLLMDVQTETELTKLLEMVMLLLEKNGIDLSTDPDLQVMLKPTDIHEIEAALEKEVNGK